MNNIEKQLIEFKTKIENAIVSGGERGKSSIIRSSQLINLIHEAVKYELSINQINTNNIYPPINATKPELKLAGFLKQKDQDVCVTPKNIEKMETPINWGPLAFNNKIDPYGFEFTEKTLIINVRSQMSSLAKNTDTLFERTFAEALNLHMRYPNAVLGEVYLIPVHEYDDTLVAQNTVGFKQRQTDLEKYISFFSAINNRTSTDELYSYERCALLIVDFNREIPYLFSCSQELKDCGYISEDFSIEYENINFQNFVKDILNIYNNRFDIDLLLP